MDPGVISVWPAICPICNMDLVPRKKMEAVMLPEGVISRMQLSPYRIQLAGIRTSVIEPRSLKFERRFSGVIRKAEDGSIGFDDDLAESDRLLFLARQSAEVRTQDLSPPVAATACVVDNSTSPRLRVALNESRALPIGTVVMANVCLNFGDGGDQLAVPESAVVDRGRERLVYVETMPGQFDGVAVELSRRCGSYYPVLHGLKPGQRVASAGAFLIDAETRLNPSLATGYFGASQSGSTASPSPPAALTAPAKAPLTKSSPSKKTLSREDQALADQQRICPVTELPLNSMGGPVPAIVGGRKVFICCTGCEKRLKDDPEIYLAGLSPK